MYLVQQTEGKPSYEVFEWNSGQTLINNLTFTQACSMVSYLNGGDRPGWLDPSKWD